MEIIYERFSGNRWLLVPEICIDKFIEKFTQNLVSNDKIWSETHSFKLERGSIIITKPINGYQIIESELLETFSKDCCIYLSQEKEIFQFEIDIWIPFMYFEYYKDGELLRRCEYIINNAENETTEIEEYETEEYDIEEYGNKLIFENIDLEMPHPEYGYDDFFYPLAIMKYLGINNSDLEKALQSECYIYSGVNNKI
jgi:hypothetical protein